MNGVYEPVEAELHNGHAIFIKAGDPGWWLLYTPTHYWAVTDTEHKYSSDGFGWAFSVKTNVGLPQDVKSWKVHVGNGKAVVQPNVRVVIQVSVCVYPKCLRACVRMSVCICGCMRINARELVPSWCLLVRGTTA